ncbi:MAG: acyl-CoA desaturase [Vampirovibrionales bacterium]|nr:acyl-CoA desaturase [Vampirovibrionales bacterium]
MSTPFFNSGLKVIRGLLDADYNPVRSQEKKLTLDRLLPFIIMHLGCLGVIIYGWSPVAVGVAVALYWLRMFLITGFFHRYFSHRTFEMNRFWQAFFAAATLITVQKGPLWWAAHHRHHHRHSDDEHDIHSPLQRGFWWSHIGWICCDANMPTRYDLIPDLKKFPELVWINRLDWAGALATIITLWALGSWLNATQPGLNTSAGQMIVWGFFISAVACFHATSTINSLSHVWGTRPYATKDTSRNNPILAFLTMGEGWHNNHHFYPGTARQGFVWWQWDPCYYALTALSWFKIVKNLRPVPNWVVQRRNTMPAGLPTVVLPRVPVSQPA